MPHPVAAQDGLLLVAGLCCSLCASKRWPSFCFPYYFSARLLCSQITCGLVHDLNHWAGPTGAYLLGFSCAIAWFWRFPQPRGKNLLLIALLFSGLASRGTSLHRRCLIWLRELQRLTCSVALLGFSVDGSL